MTDRQAKSFTLLSLEVPFSMRFQPHRQELIALRRSLIDRLKEFCSDCSGIFAYATVRDGRKVLVCIPDIFETEEEQFALSDVVLCPEPGLPFYSHEFFVGNQRYVETHWAGDEIRFVYTNTLDLPKSGFVRGRKILESYYLESYE